ncbi:nuclear pore complex protein NUP133 [Magnolia sinica]|uniref:nuclear pore complex protein NUP133 n=1 Tax=Magnolia sinica TaxID=86752 RepID=UPI00265A95A6|nr:nuclear pore complex protein NUP133 [Magnolia sinica]
MFSPATRKPHSVSQKDRNAPHIYPDSPSTPLVGPHSHMAAAASIPDRPASGTPAPWASRLSVLARIPSARKTEKGADADQAQPVYVGEFPQVVRNAQDDFLQRSAPSDAGISGGMDKGTSLCWMVCGNQVFIWSYLSPAVSKKCVVLEFPSILKNGDAASKIRHGNSWMVSVVKWDGASGTTENVVRQCNSVGIVICNQKTKAVVYWPDIYSEGGNIPTVSIPSFDESKATASPGVEKAANRHQQQSWNGSSTLVEPGIFNSLIASAIPDALHECIVLACRSNGELWQFHCSPSGIHRQKVSQDISVASTRGSDNGQPLMNKGYARSLVWRYHQLVISEGSSRQFFLLTDHELQCWNIQLIPDINISRLWSHEIVGSDGDLGIKKDLAGQKQVWLLDLQIDDRGKEFTVLVATFCKDRVSSSSYMQYSLLTMQYKSGLNLSSENFASIHERVLEKKAPIQVIIPKARVEDEDFLFSMRLRVGGKPSGSAIILSGDGTATVANYWRGSTRLYQFDLPWDAGKALDASVFPSTEDNEEGAWVVLTEKAGIWAIPEKAVLLGGVEPPERSLSRKGSSNDGTAEEEKRSLAFGSNIAPRRASSEAWDAGNRQRAVLTIAHRTAQDEEAEALLSRLFHDFLLSGQVEGSFEKLKNSGAFEKDGETNVFARTSKSIVDTLAKHWTTTRGAEIVALAVVSSQLLEKQQKHQRFLQFLALSKCHEELSSRQRHSLQIIMEHGEKLAAIIQLRDLQNMPSQNRSDGRDSPYSNSRNEMSSSLWDLIQIVGEKARRNTVLLMDRDNAEVFYSRVSDLEEVFNCLSHHLPYIIEGEQPFTVQIQRAFEVSNACTALVRTAMQYRDAHQTWYPSPEGLTPWYCQSVVRSGLWSIASFILQLLKEVTEVDSSAQSDFFPHMEGLADVILEAYAVSITAKIERGEEHKALAEEYWKRRDTLLDSLYLLIKGFVEARYQGSDKDTDVYHQIEADLRELSSPLLSIAKRHEGYQTLWNICCDLNDTGLLRTLMHASMGPTGGFSYFVFQQLYEKRNYAKLLRLGEEFQEELAIFLKPHRDLSWLHDVYLNHFSAASETLHVLALSQEDSSALLNNGGSDPGPAKQGSSLADRRHFLNLSKIAAVAGRDAGFEMKTRRIDADLQILKLQEEVTSLFPDNEEMPLTTQLLTPTQLIEMCLKSQIRELSLRAFDVFAWTSSSFRRSNKSLLEECWKNAADQDDWAGLYGQSVAEGWGDEDSLQALRGTILFHASNMCYGLEAQVFEGGFDEVLPLRQEDAESQMMKDMCSVEAVLMQHNDFPDAGKLMLTAIMMGKLGTDGKAEDAPME